MEWQSRIEVRPDVLVGKPVVKGTRIAVELVVDLMSRGWSEADILANYPNLSVDDLRACLAYASATLRAEKVYPIGAP